MQNHETMSKATIKSAWEPENKKISDCLAYFKNRPVYNKLFRKIWEKYESLGRFGGKVVLTGLDAEEKRELGGFFLKDYKEKKAVTISAAQMEKALASSRFAGFTWTEILEAYFGKPLVTKQEKSRLAEKKKREFFEEILSSCPETTGSEWLLLVLVQKKEGYSLLMQKYREEPEKLKKVLPNVLAAISALVAKEKEGAQGEFLPVFSAKLTGNPHYFDEGTMAERLLTAYLKTTFTQTLDEKNSPPGGPYEVSGAEYKHRLFRRAGILRDALSNDVLVYGIHARCRNGGLHPGIEGFAKMKEPMRLTLQTVDGLTEIWGGNAFPYTNQNQIVSENDAVKESRSMEGKKSPVYVVENPAVFSVLINRYPDRIFLCGNGQVNLAVLTLMDKLACHSVFYYAGDFDPEGLLIAQRLKLRYRERLRLWNYDAALYKKYLSDEVISEPRLKKLNKICLEELKEIKEAIREKKRAAYQEAMPEATFLPL